MRHRAQRGMALIVALLAIVVMSALAAGLVFATSTEVRIAANFSAAGAAAYAAESAVERAIQDLPAGADWTALLTGPVLSTFVDGPPTGTRRLDDNSAIDLAQVVNRANCDKAAACTDTDMNATTDTRPWGANNPRWRLYAYGPLRAMQPAGAIESPFYVVAMVGDDPAENDGDPLRDGADAANPGAGVIVIRGEAFGPAGAHAVVEATLARVASAGGAPLPGVRLLTWRANP